MRSGHQSLYEEAPSTLTLGDVSEELAHNMHSAPAKVLAWSTWVRSHLGRDVNVTAGVLKEMSFRSFNTSCEEAELSGYEAVQIRICLGTIATPFQFPKETNISKGAGETTCKQGEKKGKKGGSQKESSQILRERRPPLKMGQYSPPPAFDAHRLGAPTRNEPILRKLIVQEVRRTSIPTHTAAYPRTPRSRPLLLPLFR